MALSVCGAAIPVVTAWITKLAMDALAAQGTMEGVVVPAFGLALIGLATSVSPLMSGFAGAELDRRISLMAQDRLYRVVGRLPGLARFEDPAFLDRLRLAAQSGGMSPGQVGEAVLGMVGGLTTVAGFLGALSSVSPLMTALTLLGSLPALLAEILMAKRRASMMWSLGPVERREFFYSDLLSSTDAAKEVRIYGLGDFLHERMLNERRTANKEKRRLEQRQTLTQGVLRLGAALVSGAGLVWAMAQARAGALTIGDVLMFVAAMAGVQGGTGAFVAQFGLAHQHLLLFSHYRYVAGAEPDLPVRAERRLAPLSGHIEFENVWFRYGPDHPWVLRGVSFTIPRGVSVGLVGLNGSGKSTLVKLLCRFYDPVHGTIRWDGTDLRDIDVTDLRNRISVVFQDFMQYDLSVAENIGLGDLPRLSDREAIVSAAERAGVHDTVEALPSGYDTLMTRTFFQEDEQSEGVYLSGGQGQRIAIARALMRGERDVLILDEPSSGLDAEAEFELHSQLKKHRSGRTSVLISHRLNTVREADILVVLEGGVVAEIGDHDHLMRLGGRYAQLFTMQAAGYQDDL
ncbi:ABC transporter ATP-binding protein [Sphaerisporangium fuscum]|uniref:ABC transporter ATP-binding protein n=1 Tax=Sphaerisporangium fuscum TaxID=2835868 RepID=UPI0027E2FE87|nr:ABC transporter ATP-binding protein [Sphaerisporangium fuscum]